MTHAPTYTQFTHARPHKPTSAYTTIQLETNTAVGVRGGQIQIKSNRRKNNMFSNQIKSNHRFFENRQIKSNHEAKNRAQIKSDQIKS